MIIQSPYRLEGQRRVRWAKWDATCLLVAKMPVFAAADSAVAQEPEEFREAIGLLDAWVGNRVVSRGQPSLTIGMLLGGQIAVSALNPARTDVATTFAG
jgi:hypothetical protein